MPNFIYNIRLFLQLLQALQNRDFKLLLSYSLISFLNLLIILIDVMIHFYVKKSIYIKLIKIFVRIIMKIYNKLFIIFSIFIKFNLY